MPVQTVIRICLTAFMSHAPLMGLHAKYSVKSHRHQYQDKCDCENRPV